MNKWEEIKELVNRWEKTGLLVNSNSKLELALLLEGQYLFNSKHDLPVQFMRISIPLWVRVLNEIPVDRITGSREELSKWMELKTRYYPEISIDGRCFSDEVGLCKQLACGIVEELKQVGYPMIVHAITVESSGFHYTIKLNYDFIQE